MTADSMWGPGSRGDFLEEGAVAFPLGLRIRRVTQAAEGDPGSRKSRWTALEAGAELRCRRGSPESEEGLRPDFRVP